MLRENETSWLLEKLKQINFWLSTYEHYWSIYLTFVYVEKSEKKEVYLVRIYLTRNAQDNSKTFFLASLN